MSEKRRDVFGYWAFILQLMSENDSIRFLETLYVIKVSVKGFLGFDSKDGIWQLNEMMQTEDEWLIRYAAVKNRNAFTAYVRACLDSIPVLLSRLRSSQVLHAISRSTYNSFLRTAKKGSRYSSHDFLALSST